MNAVQSLLSRLFIDNSTQLPLLPGQYSVGLVLLSIFVSVFSATMALQTAHIARRAERPLHRHLAIGTGAIALGGGIWSMHFIGMLAFQLCTQVGYDTTLTLLSVLPSVAASWLALRTLSLTRASWPRLLLGGLLVGSGIAAMHYSGMAAMRMDALLRYDPSAFALSAVVAISFSTLALWLRFGMQKLPIKPFQRLLASGLVMGLAIAGMHYVGMAAARFIGVPGTPQTDMQVNTVMASVALSTFTLTVTVLVAAINGLIRSRELYRHMRESQLRLRSILDTAVDGIITIDRHGLIQSFNHSAERLFGWKAAEVIGHNIKMLMPVPYQSQHDGYLHNYQSTGQAKIIGSGREVTGLRKDGSLLQMRLAVGRVDLPNELLFVGFVTDIGDRKALEASLRETAERAERAAAAKGTFLANMSHEIRTPMNSIIGFTELLLRDELTPQQRRHLSTVRQSSRTLLGLINDILDTTRMEKGGMKLEAIDFSLRDLVLQVKASLQLGAHNKQLTLATHYPDEVPEYFRGDPLRVLQILTNLVGNAIKFTEKGGVTIEVGHDEKGMHLHVRDTGIGMTEQQVASVFAPFTQADASITRRFGGTGLGTTIALQLVELMGGDISVDSEPGVGSSFHVRLPLPPGKPPAPLHMSSHLPQLRPLDILIADDVPQNLELASLILRDGGHRVRTAGNGMEVVQQFIGGRFDLVLMDMHMPHVDGLEATRRIRRHEFSQGRTQTPIIALTASVMAEDRTAARSAGMNGFVVKPLDAAKLLAEIALVLDVPAPDTATETDETTSAELPLIDWPAGIARWGNRERLLRAMRGFLDECPQRHPLPEAVAERDTLRASLHGIRGAAGNLALSALAALAGHLEEQLRHDNHDVVLAQLPELRQLLRATSATLDAADPPLPKPTPTSPTTQQFEQALHSLLGSLEHGELDDDALDTLHAALLARGDAANAGRLRTALDGFEFEQAMQLLRGLADAPQPSPEP